jgi:pseudouridine-5'-phosphate glycosidase
LFNVVTPITDSGAVVVHDEVQKALREGAPVVALESTVISHGIAIIVLHTNQKILANPIHTSISPRYALPSKRAHCERT